MNAYFFQAKDNQKKMQTAYGMAKSHSVSSARKESYTRDKR